MPSKKDSTAWSGFLRMPAQQRLRASIPSGVLTVAESGVKSRSDVARIEEAGYDAVLIGETLVASVDPTATLRELMGMAQEVSR